MLLIVGGETDPNLDSLATRARARGVDAAELRVGPTRNPALRWDVEADTLAVDGRALAPSAAFVRYDVFAAMADPRPAVTFRATAWHTTLHGWLLAHEAVRVMNRGYRGQTNKPFMFALARRLGLPVPRTLITNDLDWLDGRAAEEPRIAKPVGGGGYTQPLEALLAATERRDGRAAAPALVQQRLVSPEVRIYGIGGRFLPFEVRSAALDYRDASDTTVAPLALGDVDPAVVAGLGRLMAALDMEFAAADFKTDAETGGLRFLEINSGPMFAAFDAVSDHAVSDAILDHLTRG